MNSLHEFVSAPVKLHIYNSIDKCNHEWGKKDDVAVNPYMYRDKQFFNLSIETKIWVSADNDEPQLLYCL